MISIVLLLPFFNSVYCMNNVIVVVVEINFNLINPRVNG